MGYYGLGRLLIEEGEYKKAVEKFNEGIKIDAVNTMINTLV